MALISVERLYVDFPRAGAPLKVLDGVSVAIERGEFMSIVGPSGSGKTTFLNVLSSLVRPASGKIDTGGANMAMVFQKPHLLPWRSVIENALFGLECQRVLTQEDRAAAEQLLGQMHLDDCLHDYPHQLSEGMKQRVNLARALLVKPDVLLMDEPFSALDVSTSNRLQDDLLSLWHDLQFTVLMVSHSLEEVVYLSDRIAMFTDKPVRTVEMLKVNLPRPRATDPASRFALLTETERLQKLGASHGARNGEHHEATQERAEDLGGR